MKKKLPVFATDENRKAYMTAYEAMFSLWTVPRDSVSINTGFGLTHINVCGSDNGFPLVLLHGAGLTSTVWFANIASLSAHFRVFAVDVIGDVGKSVADRLLAKREDYANWLKEVLDRLNIEKCDLLGHSYGGWLTLNMAIIHPDCLRKIVLLAPAASFLPLSFITKLILYLGEFKIHPPARKMLQVAAAKGTELEEMFIFHQEMVLRYGRSASMYPTVYTDAELRMIDHPALLLIGAGDKIYNPQKAVKRAKRLMSNLRAKIIHNSGHLLIMDQPAIVNARILEFLNSKLGM